MARRPRPDQQEYDLEELSPIRKAIGERTATSFATKPHFSTTALVDASALVALREQLKGSTEPAPTYNDMLIKATARVLEKHRRLNAWIDEEGLKVLRRINVSFAVATEQGVLLPVILDANVKSLAEIAAEAREMVEMARRGRLRASLQMGGGFVLSNIGPGRVEWFTAIISPPQVAILSIGSLLHRPMVVNGEVVARPSFYATLTVDHQAIDGADAAAFVNEFVGLLESEEALRAALGIE